MTVTSALVILLAVVELIQIVLTLGIVRRLRAGHFSAATDPIEPAAGWIVDLSRDSDPWPSEADKMLQGFCVVALVLPGCPACEQLQRDLSKRTHLAAPLYVVVESSRDTSHTTAVEWPHAISLYKRPRPLLELASFNNPTAFPAVIAMKNGVVVECGYRLQDVDRALSAYGSSPHSVYQ